MKWKLLIAAAAVAGGVAILARQRRLRASRDAELWAEATDPVAPTG